MKLSPHEIDGSAWKKTAAYIEDKLRTYRTALERDKTELETAKLRGQIQALKLVLKLAEPEQPDE